MIAVRSSEARANDARATPGGVLAAVVVGAGVVVLFTRPFVGGSVDLRVALFTTSYVAIAATSIGVPIRPGAGARAGAVAVSLAGCAAVILAAAAAGAPVPSPQMALALPVSVLAAVAEEALFRRVAFAEFERFGAIVAVVGSAVLFALVHLPAYGTTALPVDLGAGLLFGWQRWASGSWTAPAATHAFANILAVLR